MAISPLAATGFLTPFAGLVTSICFAVRLAAARLRKLALPPVLRVSTAHVRKPEGEWARVSQGCYVLRSNVTDSTPEELWRPNIQLTEAEAAFRIQKSDLQTLRDQASTAAPFRSATMVCFLAYVIEKRCISEAAQQRILTQRLGLALSGIRVVESRIYLKINSLSI